MKKFLALAMALVLALSLVACSSTGGTNDSGSSAAPNSASPAPSEETGNDTGINKKACFISAVGLGNDFTNLIVKGLEELEAEGWEVNTIEATQPAEYADQIRSCAAEGYDVVFIFGDEVSTVAVDLSEELAESNPKMHFFLLDTYMEQDAPNCTSVAVDTFESSFIAGYVAAATTTVGKVGWIGHTDMFKITRFRDGFINGVKYYNEQKGANVEYVTAFTGDYNDPVKGYETAIAMIENYGVDVIYQCNYNGGPGVIEACAEKGIKCIGVDDWQGYIDDCVFWSAIKSMDIVTYTLASTYQAGTEYGAFFNFDAKSGAKSYDSRDEGNIPAETLAEVKEIESKIADGTLDIYEGFDEYRP